MTGGDHAQAATTNWRICKARRRLERINQLWIELAQLPHDAFRTPEYRQLVRAIRVEADTFNFRMIIMVAM